MNLRDALSKHGGLRTIAWVLVLVVAMSRSFNQAWQSLLALVVIGTGLALIEKFGTPTTKPWLYLAGVSAMLFVVFVVLPARANGFVLLGAISWAAVTAGACFLLWYYKRTEIS